MNFKRKLRGDFGAGLCKVSLAFILAVAGSSAAILISVAAPLEPGAGALAPVRIPTYLDARKVELGKQLFSDTIMSSKNALSCSSCHDLSHGGTIAMKRTVGYSGKMHRFNAPTVFNVGNNYRLGWRGDFTSLEAQNEKVLTDENLMAIDWETLLSRLRNHSRYGEQFDAIYGRPVDENGVLEVLASFQQSLVTPDAPLDKYLRGDTKAMSAMAIRGYELFQSYGCVSCHQGSNIGGNMFQKFGVFADPSLESGPTRDGDLGRWMITGADRDKGVFRVPSLRNVAVTAPYFHDGRVETLSQAVSIMARVQLGRELPDPDLMALVAFLESLTGEFEGKKLRAAPVENTH
jgi:cytochrome c peroxidase